MSGRYQDECRRRAERPPQPPLLKGGRSASSPPLEGGGWGGRLQAFPSSITTVIAFLLILSTTNSLSAKTITLTDNDCERMAAISSDAPLLSWAATHVGAGEFSNHYFEMYDPISMLIQFPIDKIPPGQRIVKAEWIVPILNVYPGNDYKVSVHRLIGDWGAGVCYDYRMTFPKKVPWAQPGARGSATDRAARPTDVIKVPRLDNNYSFNVTQDVELWYSGQAKNQGWILSHDNVGVLVRIATPFYAGGRGLSKLRITYEPE